MSPRKTRAALIIAVLVTGWGADATLAVVGGHDSIRSITQGLAVTITVLAGVAWMWRSDPGRAVEPIPPPSVPARAWASVSVDSAQITMEIPRPRLPAAQSTPDTVPNMPAALAGQLYRMGLTNARRGARIMRLLP